MNIFMALDTFCQIAWGVHPDARKEFLWQISKVTELSPLLKLHVRNFSPKRLKF